MRFRIVESEAPKYSDFKALYLNVKYSKSDIMELLGMGPHMFSNWGRDVTRETGYARRKRDGRIKLVRV